MRIFHRRSSCWADRQEKRFYWFVPLTSCFFLLLLFPITFYLLLLYSLVSLVFVYLQTTSVIPCKYYWGIGRKGSYVKKRLSFSFDKCKTPKQMKSFLNLFMQNNRFRGCVYCVSFAQSIGWLIYGALNKKEEIKWCGGNNNWTRSLHVEGELISFYILYLFLY